MENYNEFEVNEQRFKVTYKYEKKSSLGINLC